MKTELFNIDSLQIRTAINPESDRIVYILYPLDVLQEWLEPAAKKYNVSIVVITKVELRRRYL